MHFSVKRGIFAKKCPFCPGGGASPPRRKTAKNPSHSVQTMVFAYEYNGYCSRGPKHPQPDHTSTAAQDPFRRRGPWKVRELHISAENHGFLRKSAILAKMRILGKKRHICQECGIPAPKLTKPMQFLYIFDVKIQEKCGRVHFLLKINDALRKSTKMCNFPVKSVFFAKNWAFCPGGGASPPRRGGAVTP